jgi:hypothetical protein
MSALIVRSGTLSYRTRSTGVERGREHWTLTVNREASRTMRCLAMTDDSEFVRDVTYTIGRDERPRDAFVRLQVRAQQVGTGYFVVDGSVLDVVTAGRTTGRVVQQVQVGERLHIVTHAVMLDAWPWWSYDRQGPAEQGLAVYNTSTRWNGTDGPLGRLETLRVTRHADETVAVPAGTFDCRHLSFDSDELKVPTSHVWLTGPDAILVRYDWAGLDLEYVLHEATNVARR